MRLRRVGAKKQPRYRVVIAQARAPRDGAFVDSIGFYDPLTQPTTIRIDREKALSWLSKGAQPSDTVQRLLRRAGIVETATAVAPAEAAEAPADGAAVATAGKPARRATEPAPEDRGAAVTATDGAEEPTDGNRAAAE